MEQTHVGGRQVFDRKLSGKQDGSLWKRNWVMMIKDLKIDSKIKLNNGVEMPILGLGTYQMASGREAKEAILSALEAGYTHIDTAKIYGNEGDVGKAIRTSGLPREEIFVTTKLWNADHGYHKAQKACERSLKLLGLSYIDLYLIHWPVKDIRRETWRAMEQLHVQGKCRAVGVSNYMTRHLEELLKSSSIIPAVNQVEFHPYLFLQDLLRFCREYRIQLEAYSPLTKGQKLDDPKLISIASKYSKTPAQVLIRWALQHEIVVIPKSTRRERILENAEVFDFSLSEEDMRALDSFNENFRTSWDPTSIS